MINILSFQYLISQEIAAILSGSCRFLKCFQISLIKINGIILNDLFEKVLHLRTDRQEL